MEASAKGEYGHVVHALWAPKQVTWSDRVVHMYL